MHEPARDRDHRAVLAVDADLPRPVAGGVGRRDRVAAGVERRDLGQPRRLEPPMLSPNKPPFRAEHIGSLLRPKTLLDLRARFARGEIGEDTLTDAENEAIKDALKLQERGGLNGRD